MVEDKKVEKIEKQKDRYVLKEVTVQKDTAIGLVDDDNVFTEKGLLVEILNKLDRIELKLGNM